MSTLQNLLQALATTSLYIAAVVVSLVLPACVSNSYGKDVSQTESPIDLSIVSQFPGAWLHRVNFAAREFSKTGYDVSCFTVTMGHDKSVDLYFVSISPTINLTAAGGFGRVKGCGIGVAYYFKDTGEFVRSEIQK